MLKFRRTYWDNYGMSFEHIVKIGLYGHAEVRWENIEIYSDPWGRTPCWAANRFCNTAIFEDDDIPKTEQEAFDNMINWLETSLSIARYTIEPLR